ncbi:MAG: VacJ family lipoprotein [Alphaproteobacteria bacterium]
MKFLGWCLLLAFILCGCSTVQDSENSAKIPDEEDEFTLAEPDPLELFNRYMYGFNRVIDAALIKPVAIMYDQGVPENVKYCTTSFVKNAYGPTNILNHTLQGEMDNAGKTSLRFLLNTTFGFLGLIDFAEFIGISEETTSFNETLATWGVEAGPYIMLPILGPTTFRGAYGYAFDWFADPLRIFANHSTCCINRNHRVRDVLWGVSAANIISTRAELLNTLDDIYETSKDSYVTIRSIVFQRQQRVDKKLQKEKVDD